MDHYLEIIGVTFPFMNQELVDAIRAAVEDVIPYIERARKILSIALSIFSVLRALWAIVSRLTGWQLPSGRKSPARAHSDPAPTPDRPSMLSLTMTLGQQVARLLAKTLGG